MRNVCVCVVGMGVCEKSELVIILLTIILDLCYEPLFGLQHKHRTNAGSKMHLECCPKQTGTGCIFFAIELPTQLAWFTCWFC